MLRLYDCFFFVFVLFVFEVDATSPSIKQGLQMDVTFWKCFSFQMLKDDVLDLEAFVVLGLVSSSQVC